MIGAPEFAAMKPTAVVINVGRGPVIDEQALVGALVDKRIKGAALDVFDQEPLPPGHAFYKLDNVLLSPHCADNTPDWLEQSMELFITQFKRFRSGEPLLNVVRELDRQHRGLLHLLICDPSAERPVRRGRPPVRQAHCDVQPAKTLPPDRLAA